MLKKKKKNSLVREGLMKIVSPAVFPKREIYYSHNAIEYDQNWPIT